MATHKITTNIKTNFTLTESGSKWILMQGVTIDGPYAGLYTNGHDDSQISINGKIFAKSSGSPGFSCDGDNTVARIGEAGEIWANYGATISGNNNIVENFGEICFRSKSGVRVRFITSV